MCYDILIVGGGPAGLSAAINGRVRGKTVLLLSSPMEDSPLWKAERVENYLGLPGVTGAELLTAFRRHAEASGAELRELRALSAMPVGDRWYLSGEDQVFEGRALILAAGAVRGKSLPGEERLLGRGVSYCATCDGNFFRGRDTAVVGGGNTALEDALFLANICPNVYLVHRRDTFKAERHLIDALAAAPNIHVLLSHKVVEVQGEQAVTSLLVEGPDGRCSLPVAGVFAAVGLAPDNQVFSPPLELNEAGYIIAGEDTRTNVPGIFAAGDTRVKDLRQLVTAAADGASAASQAGRYLQSAQ